MRSRVANLLLALLSLCAVPVCAQTHTVAEQYLFQAINAERAAAGLRALVWNDALSSAARGHAFAMRDRGGISHQFAGEPDVAQRASAAGARFSHLTENVATSDSVVTMHRALMQSPHHRQNILDAAVTSMGVAVVSSRGAFWGVEDFSRDVAQMSLEQQEQEVERLLTSAGLRQVEATAEARATCTMETGYSGDRPRFVMRYTTSDLNRLPVQLTDKLAAGGFRLATVGACERRSSDSFSGYSVAVLLFP